MILLGGSKQFKAFWHPYFCWTLSHWKWQYFYVRPNRSLPCQLKCCCSSTWLYSLQNYSFVVALSECMVVYRSIPEKLYAMKISLAISESFTNLSSFTRATKNSSKEMFISWRITFFFLWHKRKEHMSLCFITRPRVYTSINNYISSQISERFQKATGWWSMCFKSFLQDKEFSHFILTVLLY